MPDSAVVAVVRRFKDALLRQEQAQLRAMAARWVQVERRLFAQMDALALEMAARQAAGEVVSVNMLFVQVRYRELLVQLQDELATYNDYAERTITQRQDELVRLALQQSQQAISVQGVAAGFNQLPVEAVQNLVGFAGDGSPLNVLLRQSWPLAARGLTDELINGIALGLNPRQVARNMANGATGSLDRMMTIARTEQLRAYRSASLDNYRASGVVTSYVRYSARDARVCAGCLAADGTEYALETEFAAHPNCRCTLLPKVQGIPLTFQRGSEWFETQPERVQKEILGPGRYELYQAGTPFSAFAALRTNATWGDAIVPATLGELVQ